MCWYVVLRVVGEWLCTREKAFGRVLGVAKPAGISIDQ